MKRGFNKIIKQFYGFHPFEIEQIVCGITKELDLKEMEITTGYDGYTVNDTIIQDFWKIVHGFYEEDKSKLLMFINSSDRIPLNGIKYLQIIIQKNDSTDRLPTALTCFCRMLLPN